MSKSHYALRALFCVSILSALAACGGGHLPMKPQPTTPVLIREPEQTRGAAVIRVLQRATHP